MHVVRSAELFPISPRVGRRSLNFAIQSQKQEKNNENEQKKNEEGMRVK